MTGLTCTIQAERSVAELIQRRNAFAFLRHSQPVRLPQFVWNRANRKTYDLQVIAIGKTGYGKSTALNKLIGEDVFETSDIQGCTRVMQSAEFQLQTPEKDCYFSLADLPGIGESPALDKEYIGLYRNVLSKAHAVIYFLRADQRDYSIDLWAFDQLFAANGRDKVILAVNAIDKVEPLSRGVFGGLSEQQQQNLQLKLTQISKQFSIPAERIVALSATEHINLDGLAYKMAEQLKPYLAIAI